MFTGLWKLLTSEAAFSEFWHDHGAVFSRVALYGIAEALKVTGTGGQGGWWVGLVLQALALGFQGGEVNK